MKLSFYDPEPFRNDYLSIMYFGELKKYSLMRGIDTEVVEDLNIKNSTILLNGRYLSPDTIIRLKEDDNFIVAFDINDNTFFTDVDDAYGTSTAVMHIDLMFKVAGLQRTLQSYDPFIDDDLNYSRKKVPFRGGNWGSYFDFLDSGRMKSLPYPPWYPIHVDQVPWEKRNGLTLLRGSHQYQRAHLFFHLLKAGLIDKNTKFQGEAYVFQYCDDCKMAFKKHGRMTYDYLESHPDMYCRLKNWKGGSGLPYRFMGNPEWNNSCLPRYMDMAVMFQEKHGGLDMSMVEDAFNGIFQPIWMNEILNRYSFYADIKWIYSIYEPPRFWEAACAYTINLVPERTRDQDTFPQLLPDEHYVTYKEDFSDLKEVTNITKEKFCHITNNCYDLYNKWIRPEDYALSTNLLQHILNEIEGAGGGK